MHINEHKFNQLELIVAQAENVTPFIRCHKTGVLTIFKGWHEGILNIGWKMDMFSRGERISYPVHDFTHLYLYYFSSFLCG